MKMIEFDKTVTVDGTTYKAGAKVDAEKVPAGYLATCLRLGYAHECEQEEEAEPKAKLESELADTPGETGDPKAEHENAADTAEAKKSRKKK
jgi:V8-like Glu-specific endopeptidase